MLARSRALASTLPYRFYTPAIRLAATIFMPIGEHQPSCCFVLRLRRAPLRRSRLPVGARPRAAVAVGPSSGAGPGSRVGYRSARPLLWHVGRRPCHSAGRPRGHQATWSRGSSSSAWRRSTTSDPWSRRGSTTSGWSLSALGFDKSRVRVHPGDSFSLGLKKLVCQGRKIDMIGVCAVVAGLL